MKLVALPSVDIRVDASVVPTVPGAMSAAVSRGTGTVMAFTQGLRGYASEHEQMTRMEVVRRLARLKGFDVSEEFAQPPATGPVYLVPSDTIVGVERAQALGIRGRDDFFGGVVAHPFVSTKAITHPLVSPDAFAPQGWSHAFHAAVADAVLPGLTAFTREDALQAGERMLQLGDARVKGVRETGGHGQTVVRSSRELRACLEAISDTTLARDGIVIEQNLESVQTLSVGQVWVAGMVATYHGTQRLTRNNQGEEVYGGSDLTVVRGDFQALRAQPLAREVRIAVEQALLYDAAATECFPGFFASRINYDIVQGLDAKGHWHSAVLEQSWRAGGATGAEIAALEAFQSDPGCNVAHTACVETYGAGAQLPAGAAVYFQGEDAQVGPLSKYTVVLNDAHTP
jgi:hypothetical protein